MRTYSEAFDAAREGSPFSNGSQGYGWMARNCDRCIHDKPARQGDAANGCPLILVALMRKTPAEWLAETEQAQIFADYTCVEFRDEDNPGGAEPEPIPDPPGQLALAPREPYEGVRMLSPLPERQEVAS